MKPSHPVELVKMLVMNLANEIMCLDDTVSPYSRRVPRPRRLIRTGDSGDECLKALDARTETP